MDTVHAGCSSGITLAWPGPGWPAWTRLFFFLIGFAKNVCMLFFSSNHYFLQVWCILHLLHYFFHLRYYCIICASWHIMHVFRSLFLYLCHSYNYPVHVIGIPNVYKDLGTLPLVFLLLLRFRTISLTTCWKLMHLAHALLSQRNI